MFKYGIDHLTTSKALAILRNELQAELCEEAVVRINQSYENLQIMAQAEEAIYGINTGFGPLCNTKIPASQTEALQENLLKSHSVGVGDAIDTEIAKLMLILKVHALCKGFSGVSLEIIKRIIWHIDEDIIPVVPSQGSVGASGDLAPLSHLFLPLIGEGAVVMNGSSVHMSSVLTQHQMESISLHPKAGLALINGTQFILAHAVLLVDRMHNALVHADLVGAMMVEGLKASIMPFHAALHDVRPHPGGLHVASNMMHYLKGSPIVSSHEDCDRVQDPYSIRCIPQVHGSSRSAWVHLKEAVEIELNAVTDNPILFSSEYAISGGNFHGQPLAMPIDYACLAMAELGSISDRRTYLALDGRYEVPKLLMEETGVNSGFMIVQYTAAALVSENKGLCFPSSADSIPTSMGQEDHVSMGSIGARKALRMCDNLERILAIELLCAAQALEFNRPLRSTDIIEGILSQVRERVSFAREDRMFSPDIESLTQLIKSKKLTKGVQVGIAHGKTGYTPEQFEDF